MVLRVPGQGQKDLAPIGAARAIFAKRGHRLDRGNTVALPIGDLFGFDTRPPERRPDALDAEHIRLAAVVGGEVERVRHGAASGDIFNARDVGTQPVVESSDPRHSSADAVYGARRGGRRCLGIVRIIGGMAVQA